jgi:phospholipid transport system substrate-binding protein
MKIIKFVVLSCCLFLTISSWAETPVTTLQNTANRIITTLKENKTRLRGNHQLVYDAVEQHLLPIVDVNGMARSVLGRNAWMKASTSERVDFTRAFTQLIIRTYASPLADYSDETVRFLPFNGSLTNRFIKINSIIVRSSGNNIPLNYSLVSINGQWKIYDLSIEGVSLLQSFRSQFAQALQDSNISTLVKQMHEHHHKAN